MRPAVSTAPRPSARVAGIAASIVSVPYDRREVSYQVARDGVTSIIVKVTTDDGVVGWGEACSGADAASVRAAVDAMAPLVIGRDLWHTERMRADLWHHGLWQFRAPTANFAWAGIEMAILDALGRREGLAVHQLLGGTRRDHVNYFYYLSRGPEDDLREQCREGLAAGFSVFYLKVGLTFADDVAMVATVRDAVGPDALIRIDANGAWSVAEAIRNIEVLAAYGLDFVEQPVREWPIESMQEVRARSAAPIAANEGLWTESDAIQRVLARSADVVCFSPYWVGSVTAFQRIGTLASTLGIGVCKHTHGELGLAAAASHHALLTMPGIVTGNQQTATHMLGDLLTTRLPIADGPDWGIPEGVGLCVEVDADALADAEGRYAREGQFLPYQLDELRRAWG
jgi:L-alanine-DL-glutamate epimerase-like enolase superfamily enzyme